MRADELKRLLDDPVYQELERDSRGIMESEWRKALEGENKESRETARLNYIAWKNIIEWPHQRLKELKDAEHKR